MNCIKSLPKPNIVDKREALGEHLFNKVAEITHFKNSQNVGIITGILLEEDEKTIYKFLQDRCFLQCAVDKVLPSILSKP